MRWGLVLFLLLLAGPVHAGREHIGDLRVAIVDQDILISFALKNGFTGKIERDIHDGIEKDFYYYVLLSRKHEQWFDKEIVAKTIRHTVKYDTLKKIYTVRRNEGVSLTEQIFDQMEPMRAFVTTETRFPLAKRSDMQPVDRYFVRVKGQMRASQVPLYLDRLLFFIPFLDLDTPWIQSRSFYAESTE